MLADLLRSENYKVVFSVLLGIAVVVVVFRPYCRGDECSIWKAPPTKEINGSVFKVGSKCYKFSENNVECGGKSNIVEAFRGEFVCRPQAKVREAPMI